MKILQVNQLAGQGGASGICLALHKAYLTKGPETAVLVGKKLLEIPGVCQIAHDQYRSSWARVAMIWSRWLNKYSGHIRGAHRISERWLPRLASSERMWAWWSGHEDFYSPGTGHLLEQAPFKPDILHLHNLHGDYFDLRFLPRLSKDLPTIITLHDAWLLTGHCAYFISCDRWKTGCGSCPRLDIPPAIRKDATAFNWRRKQQIYQNSELTMVCPSQWLADKVSQSMLMCKATRLLVIPNGVDTSVFIPGDKMAARGRLGWPKDAFIVMFAANGVRTSVWKDYVTMREAVRLAGNRIRNQRVCFFAVGDSGPAEHIDGSTIEFVAYQKGISDCYQAADVYIHAAKADTFPTSIIEALACGIPVVATAVGGIPEQIIEGKNGFLSPAGDANSLAENIIRLAESPDLINNLGIAARNDAVGRFSVQRMVDGYINAYKELLERKKRVHDN